VPKSRQYSPYGSLAFPYDSCKCPQLRVRNLFGHDASSCLPRRGKASIGELVCDASRVVPRGGSSSGRVPNGFVCPPAVTLLAFSSIVRSYAP